jgi:hypothetical protein
MLPSSMFGHRLFTLTTIVGLLVNRRSENVSNRTHPLFTIPETGS